MYGDGGGVCVGGGGGGEVGDDDTIHMYTPEAITTHKVGSKKRSDLAKQSRTNFE